MSRLGPAVAVAAALLIAATSPGVAPARAETSVPETAVVTHYRTATVDGVKIFYREAGPTDGPVVLLLHGFPSSSHMFRNLIPALGDRYHVIAPDYPGFGESETPDRETFAYTFAHYTDVIGGLLDQIGAQRYAMYVTDYGAPVGLRLALKHPERVTALVVQNGNAYDEGLKLFWKRIKEYWSDGYIGHRNALRSFLKPETTAFRYTDGVSDVSRIDPETWMHDQELLDRTGNTEIQLDLLYDYRTNVALYPDFHAYFRARRPPTLIVWGANDQIFPIEGARAFMADLPDAELHLLDTGHFALEDKLDVIAPLVRDFLDRKIPPR